MPSYTNPWFNPFKAPDIEHYYGFRGGGSFDFMESDNGYAGWGLFLDKLNAPRAGKGWLQQQYPELYRQYASTQGADPTLTWFKLLQNLDLKKLYDSATPYERGLRPVTYAPRLRLI